MNKNQMSIISLDWGKKRIGVAYWQEHVGVVMPLAVFDNNQNVLFVLAGEFVRLGVKKVLIGYPKHEVIRGEVDNFIRQLTFVIDQSIEIVRVNEEYSSVQANELLGNYKKTVEEDVLSAMVILKEYLRINV